MEVLNKWLAQGKIRNMSKHKMHKKMKDIKDVGMACQKVCKQSRDDIQVKANIPPSLLYLNAVITPQVHGKNKAMNVEKSHKSACVCPMF